MKKTLRPCDKNGCNQLTRERYCEEHKELVKESRKRDHKKFYNSKAWQLVRVQALMRDSFLCVHCKEKGITTKAAVVDHRLEVSDRYDLRLTLSNLQSLCHACHNKKTAEVKKERETFY